MSYFELLVYRKLKRVPAFSSYCISAVFPYFFSENYIWLKNNYIPDIDDYILFRKFYRFLRDNGIQKKSYNT